MESKSRTPILCRLGLHLAKHWGVTIGGYVRCYACGKDHWAKAWHSHQETLDHFAALQKGDKS